MLRWFPLVMFVAASVGVQACGGTTPASTDGSAPPSVSRLTLPDSIAFPEGVAFDEGANALYTASAEDGTVVRVHLATGSSEIVTGAGMLMPAGATTFPGPLGMEVDGAGRLWIAGGFTGKVWIVDTADGALIADVQVPTAPDSLINDVAIVGAAGYFTDTFVPTLWRVAETDGAFGTPEPWLDLRGSGIEYDGDGPKLNGITVTPDGQTLLVVHMGQGRLFRIDIPTRNVMPIDTGEADLTTADGLVLDGNTLYVIRQGAQEVVSLTLADDLSSATVVARFTEGLAWPATGARIGDDLVVVNTQFNTRDTNSATRPFSLLRIPVERLR